MDDALKKVKKGKLLFKGDKPKLKKQKHKKPEEAEEEIEDHFPKLPQDGWIKVHSDQDLIGPLLITQSHQDNSLVCLTSDERGSVYLSKLQLDEEGRPNPNNVHQVFYSNKIFGTKPSDLIFSLKNVEDSFMSCDKYGQLTAERKAIGNQEEWTYCRLETGFALQSTCYQTYLQATLLDKPQLGQIGSLRADCKEVGFRETFTLYCQVQEVRNRLEKERKQKEKKIVIESDPKSIELEQISKLQSWHGGTTLQWETGDSKELKDAKERGRLNEKLLERRIKIKSDKFCK